jgi:hypothetical protein
MRALEHPFTTAPVSLLEGTPVAALALLAAAWLVGALTLPAAGARAVGLAVVHGALLGTALAWTVPERPRARWAPLEAALLLGAATLLARLSPWGVVAYAAVPCWVAWWRAAGRGAGDHARAVATGAVFGVLLGAHLLVNASLTLGFHVGAGRAHDVVAWIGYDLGANVLAAEAFFRGGLFVRAHRRWPFAAAAAIATAASVARYLADPLLPHAPEILAGATFYLALLGVGNCWLLARHGSLAGPVTAGLCFFAAYRMLAR